MTRIVAGLEEAGYVARAATRRTAGPCSSTSPHAGAALIRARAPPGRQPCASRVGRPVAPADRAALVAALPVLEALGRDGEG